MLRHPHSKAVFPHSQLELLALQFVPVTPSPVTGHRCKEPGPVLLTLALEIFVCIDKIPPPQPSLLWAKQAQCSQPFPLREMLIILVASAGPSPVAPCLS